MDSAWIRRLLDSYAFWLKEDLVERTRAIDEQSRRLFFAPFVVVSHADSEDPILNYGNRQALDLWEMTWAEFIATPSRLTVEPMNRDARARMLHRVAVHGFITDYQGVRISRTGRRFLVERATVWNVLDEHRIKRGQAASFSQLDPLGPHPWIPAFAGRVKTLTSGYERPIRHSRETGCVKRPSERGNGPRNRHLYVASSSRIGQFEREACGASRSS